MHQNNYIDISKQILDNQLELAQQITAMHFEHQPELEIKYGKTGREKCIQDSIYHLSYLAQAINIGSTEIFNTYLSWAVSMLQARNIPSNDLLQNLKYSQMACSNMLSADASEIINHFLKKGIDTLATENTGHVTYISSQNPLQQQARQFLNYLLAGNRNAAQQLIQDLYQQGTAIADIYEHIFQTSQYEVGLLWQKNEITVAHEHYCTAATQLIMSSLYPYIFDMEKKAGKLLACTVSGDLHEIGIRMVSDLFEMDGWDTYYLGANMPDTYVISAAKEQQSNVLAISVTMPYHVSKAQTLIAKIRADESLSNLKIIVGGYPFGMVTDLWSQIGADGSARSAKEAIKLANQLYLLN